MSETFEETFCRLASEVVAEQNLAPLPIGMSDDLLRFLRYFQEKAHAVDTVRGDVRDMGRPFGNAGH